MADSSQVGNRNGGKVAMLWSKFTNIPLFRDMTARSTYVACTICIGASVYGYDISWWSSILGMPAFTRRFGIYQEQTDSYVISAPLQSAGSSVPRVGVIFGAFICHMLSDRFGRRMTLLITCILFIAAAIVEVATNTFWSITVGRLLNSVPIGIAAVLLPSYQAECAPASCRGSLLSIYTWFLDVGAVTAVGIVYNTWNRPDSGAYKIVMGCQMIYPILIICTLPWLPESPRFLCMKGKHEEARKVLRQLRPASQEIDGELMGIQASLEHHESSSWRELFQGSNRRRTLITFGTITVEAWQGLSFIANYLVVFFISLGTTDVYQLVLLINAVLLITLTFFFWAPDYFGRRTLLLFGSACMWATFFVMAGVGGYDVRTITATKQRVCVAMLFIWTIVYSCTWANVSWITIGEMPQMRVKAKTSGTALILQNASTIAIALFSPYLQSDRYVNWGAYIGFFFGSFSFVSFCFVYFFYPEVKGLSIEQIDLLFEQGASIKQFSAAARGRPLEIVEAVDDVRGKTLAVDSQGKDDVQVASTARTVGIADADIEKGLSTDGHRS